MSKPVTVADLTSLDLIKKRPFLRCARCGNRASADRRDYFTWDHTHVFTCCGQPMTRAFERVTYREV
jgi:hypothetical protein